MSSRLKIKKALPFEFVLEALDTLSPQTRPMFGCTAVYVGEKIMLILRDKAKKDSDTGIWICTRVEHHDSLRSIFPSMKSIEVLGKSPTNWQLLPAAEADFEESANTLCELILRGDERIGRVPDRKKKKARKG